ncbi:MAG: NIPSNAP family protein [Streptosporangiaceae bacterium]
MAGVIEIRTYRAQPGERGELTRLLQDRLFPVHQDLGIRVLGVFPSAEDDNTLVWLRAFPDADSREAMTKAFYGGSQWTDELAGLILPLIAEHSVILIEDTPGLWDRWPAA